MGGREEGEGGGVRGKGEQGESNEGGCNCIGRAIDVQTSAQLNMARGRPGLAEVAGSEKFIPPEDVRMS